jgi:hypothetical protein
MQHETEGGQPSGPPKTPQAGGYTYEQYLADLEGSKSPNDPPSDFPLQGFWRSVRHKFSGLPAQTRLDAAIEQGAKKAANEAGNLVASAFGVSREENPLRFDVTERPGGLFGVVEQATQFAVGMVGFGKLKPVAKLGAVAKGATAGLLTDLTLMDPYEARLSNIVESGPEWLSNPVSRFLAADADDSEAAARVKSAFEGVLTGAAVDALIWGARAVRYRRAGKIAEAEEAIRKASQANSAAEPVEVVHTPGEPSVIRMKGGAAGEEFRVEDPAQAESLAAAMSDAVRNDQIPPQRLTTDQRTAVQDLAQRIQAGADPADMERLLDGVQINLSRSAEPEDVKAWVTALGNEAGEVAKALANRVTDGNGQGWAETTRLAADWLDGVDGDEMAQRVAHLFGDTERLPQRIYGTRLYLWSRARQVRDLSRRVELDPENPVLQAELSRTLDSLYNVHNWLAGTSANVGRSLDAHRIPVSAEDAAGVPKAPQVEAPTAPQGRRLSEQLSPRELRGLARQFAMSDADPKQVFGLLQATKRAKETPNDPTVWSRVHSFRANMLLSGPKTHLVNAASNLATAFQVPAEYWWAGVRSGNAALKQQGADLLVGNALYLKDAARAAWRVLKAAENELDPLQMQLEHETYARPGMGWLSGLVNVPSRLLMSSDEFFKQVSYRSHVRAHSLKLARDQGITDPAAIAERLATDMELAFSAEGRGANRGALDHARYTTFSSPLKEGTLGAWLQQGANESPFLRLVFPFVRTPVNIFRFAWHRTPVLSRLSKEVREDLAAGGERAAIARARQDVGVTLYSMGASLAAGGMITGGGPKDPRLRAQWLAAGNQPYSLRVAGQQISYQRLEPLATPLAVVADAFEAFGELGEEDAGSAITSIVAGMMSAAASKTFLLGMSEFFDAMASGEAWKVERLTKSLALSFTPNLLRQINGDPVWRETRGLIDELQARVPGLSGYLEPRRNIFGEPVLKAPHYFNRTMNPFASMQAPRDEDVAVQLLELGKAFPIPSESRMDGRIDLADRETFDNGTGQSPYDRMMELLSEPKGNNPSLRDALEGLVASEAWKNAGTGTEVYPGGLRFKLAERVIVEYHEAAKGWMLQEYPKLQVAIAAERKQQIRSLFEASK